MLRILSWQPIISELALMDEVLGHKLTPKFWTAFKHFLPGYPMNTSTLQNPFYSSFCRHFQGMQCFVAISRPYRARAWVTIFVVAALPTYQGQKSQHVCYCCLWLTPILRPVSIARVKIVEIPTSFVVWREYFSLKYGIPCDLLRQSCFWETALGKVEVETTKC